AQNNVDTVWDAWVKNCKSRVMREKWMFSEREKCLFVWQNESIFTVIYCYRLSDDDEDDLFNELKIDGTTLLNLINSPFENIAFENIKSKLDSMYNFDDPYYSKMSNEEQDEYLELRKKIVICGLKSFRNGDNRYLTTEQKKRSQEIQIMFMNYYPTFITPHMFNALGLSREQKTELNRICRELEPDYKKYIDEFLESEQSWKDKLANKVVGYKFKNNKEFFEMQKTFEKEWLEGEMQKLLQKRRVIVDKLKSGMLKVLTDKQKRRMNELINNPPESVRKNIEVLINEYNITP
ncbi:MAG: hypothetical protein LBU65_04680, partial [Planctomycetaceae bacterium]|nr:hypothetical protein [Planctomycetaceae bacterium]